MPYAFHKFPLDRISDVVTFEMPKGTRVVSLQVQRGVPCMWAIVDLDAEKVTRRFRVVGTGHELQYFPHLYVGTFQGHGDVLVFHVYEELVLPELPPDA